MRPEPMRAPAQLRDHGPSARHQPAQYLRVSVDAVDNRPPQRGVVVGPEERVNYRLKGRPQIDASSHAHLLHDCANRPSSAAGARGPDSEARTTFLRVAGLV